MFSFKTFFKYTITLTTVIKNELVYYRASSQIKEDIKKKLNTRGHFITFDYAEANLIHKLKEGHFIRCYPSFMLTIDFHCRTMTFIICNLIKIIKLNYKHGCCHKRWCAAVRFAETSGRTTNAKSAEIISLYIET